MNNISFKGFLETSFVDWPGRITSVVFLPGCSFACGWCHNRALWESPDTLDDVPIHTVLDKVAELSDFVDGITITGGEPTVHKNLKEIVSRLRSAAPVKLDTNGSNPGVVKSLLDANLLDGVSMDIKAPLNTEHYSRVAGVQVNMDHIRKSIGLILDSGLWYEFRTTAVPTLHTPEDIDTIRNQMVDLAGGPLKRPLKLQMFKPNDDMPDPWHSISALNPDQFTSQ